MNRSLALLIFAAATIALPRVAAAKPHVALLPITGDASGELVDAMTAAVEDDVSPTTPREIARTIDKLGLGDELADRDLQKLVTELDVDAVVRSTLERDGSFKVLHVRVYAFGKKSHGFTVRFANAKSPKFKRAVHDALMGKLALVGATGAAGKGDDDAGSEGDDAGADDRDRDRSDGGGSGAAHHRHDKDKDKDRDSDTDKDTDKDEAGSDGRANAPPLAVLAAFGASVLGRSFTFNSTNIPQAPKPYTQSPVPGARFAGELYPFAFRSQGWAAGIGLAADYDQTLALTLHTPAEPATPLRATQRHWSIGVRYRIMFGHRPTSPSLTLGVSYAGREFIVDRAPLMGATIDLPDVDYMIIAPGASFRLPLSSRVAITLGARALIVRSAGTIEDADQYGDASVDGFEGELGVELRLGHHMALRLAGEFTQIAFSFVGNGTLANDRDMDPSTIDVAGATDRDYGGAATFAVIY